MGAKFRQERRRLWHPRAVRHAFYVDAEDILIDIEHDEFAAVATSSLHGGRSGSVPRPLRSLDFQVLRVTIDGRGSFVIFPLREFEGDDARDAAVALIEREIAPAPISMIERSSPGRIEAWSTDEAGDQAAMAVACVQSVRELDRASRYEVRVGDRLFDVLVDDISVGGGRGIVAVSRIR